MKGRLALAALLALLTGPGSARDDLDPQALAQRVEQLAKERRDRQKDASWREPAQRLGRAADRDYRRQRYSEAARNYRDAHPSYPTSYLLLMASDAHLRAVLKAQRASADASSACLPALRFADDLALTLWNGADTALALALRTEDKAFLRSRPGVRAKPMAACLHVLAGTSAASPADRCADLDALQRCLGTPLIP